MADGRKSNYEKMKNDMAAVFLKYDQDKMIRKFDLQHDEDSIWIRFVGRTYQIRRRIGSIFWVNDGQQEVEAGYNEVMTIYDVMCNSKEDCHLARNWVNVGSLSAVKGGSLSKTGHFFSEAGKAFEGKTELLMRACERLGGRKLSGGDAAYEIELFPFLPIVLRFWDADEEFSGSLQILTDENILDYMHYETLMFALSHVLERIRQEMSYGGE